MAEQQRRLSVVPAKNTNSRQAKALAEIEANKLKNNFATFSHPAVRQPVLDSNAVSRSATKEIEPTPMPSLLSRIKNNLRRTQ